VKSLVFGSHALFCSRIAIPKLHNHHLDPRRAMVGVAIDQGSRLLLER